VCMYVLVYFIYVLVYFITDNIAVTLHRLQRYETFEEYTFKFER